MSFPKMDPLSIPYQEVGQRVNELTRSSEGIVPHHAKRMWMIINSQKTKRMYK